METEKQNVFVYIRGVAGRGEEVINTLVELGGANHLELKGADSNWLYYINSTGTIESVRDDDSYNPIWLKTHYTEIFLPKEEHKFKPFERVLGRISSISPWRADLYSHYDEDVFIDNENGYRSPGHICVGGAYEECIPYEGNEHLLGTTANPE